MKDTTGILAVLDRQIQALQQSRPEFRPELQDLLGARATVAELMAVVEAFLETAAATQGAGGTCDLRPGTCARCPVRRLLIELLPGGGVACASIFRPHPARSTHMTQHLTQAVRDCITACNECATECGNCFSQMVGMESKNDCPVGPQNPSVQQINELRSGLYALVRRQVSRA